MGKILKAGRFTARRSGMCRMACWCAKVVRIRGTVISQLKSNTAILNYHWNSNRRQMATAVSSFDQALKARKLRAGRLKLPLPAITRVAFMNPMDVDG